MCLGKGVSVLFVAQAVEVVPAPSRICRFRVREGAEQVPHHTPTHTSWYTGGGSDWTRTELKMVTDKKSASEWRPCPWHVRVRARPRPLAIWCVLVRAVSVSAGVHVRAASASAARPRPRHIRVHGTSTSTVYPRPLPSTFVSASASSLRPRAEPQSDHVPVSCL